MDIKELFDETIVDTLRDRCFNNKYFDDFVNVNSSTLGDKVEFELPELPKYGVKCLDPFKYIKIPT